MASKMASRRRDEDSDEESEMPCANKFVNDGSFLEAFKKKMQEQNSKSSSSKAEDKKETKSLTRTENTESKEPVEKGKDGEDTSSPAHLKSIAEPCNGLLGKRKALMKTAELREKRKKHREELEQEQSVEGTDAKSQAWKAYMAEVKAYQERTCSDHDGHKRPLVK